MKIRKLIIFILLLNTLLHMFHFLPSMPVNNDLLTQNNLINISGNSLQENKSPSDIFVSHVEITQGIQNEENSIPLITDKPTFLRVYLSHNQNTEIENVSAYIDASFSGVPVGRAYPTNDSITVFAEDWRNQRSDINKSLNFALPLLWSQGLLTLMVKLEGSNELIGGVTLSSGKIAEPIRVTYIPIRYQDRDPDITSIQEGFVWASKIFPTAHFYYVRGPNISWNQTISLNDEASVEALLNELTLMYRLAPANVFVYGWLPENSISFGNSDPDWYAGNNVAAFGPDQPGEGQRIFTHEIGHLLGRRHTNTSSCRPDRIDVDSDWEYPDSTIQDWGLDGYSFGFIGSMNSAVKNPSTTFDYMSRCGSLLSADVWTSGFTYEHIFNERLNSSIRKFNDTPVNYIVLSGSITTDDIVQFNPSWLFSSENNPRNPIMGTEYCLEMQDSSNVVLESYCFDLNFINLETGTPTTVKMFNIALVYSPELSKILLKKGLQVIAEQNISANSPSATLISPNGGELWASDTEQTIQWIGSDLDDDEVTYRVFYSHDGLNWEPLSISTTETQLTINTNDIRGSTDAKIRVVASDGLNTTSDESDNSFIVENKKPDAFIISPEKSGTIPPETPFMLQGYGYDPEDGELLEENINWSSSKDGELGTGTILFAQLSDGQHTITLEVNDSSGNTSIDTVEIQVGFKTYIPINFK